MAPVLPAAEVRWDLVPGKFAISCRTDRQTDWQSQTCPHTKGKGQQVRTLRTWKLKAKPQIWMPGSRALKLLG